MNNLIDINKIDSGHYKLSFSNNNIVSIIEDITMSVIPYVENKNINLIFDTDSEEIITSCDPESIERIILNLLSNAIKYTPSDIGEIIVGIKRNEDKQNLVWVYEEAFAELKKRNPIMSKLYSYQLVFLDDEEDDIVREDENEQEANSINN